MSDTTKPATVTREHRELAARLLFPGGYAVCSGVAKWVQGSLSAFERGMEPRMVAVAQAIADAEARGEQRGREAERAELAALKSPPRAMSVREAQLHGDPAVIRQAELDALRGR